jgi:hypothetical protein
MAVKLIVADPKKDSRPLAPFIQRLLFQFSYVLISPTSRGVCHELSDVPSIRSNYAFEAHDSSKQFRKEVVRRPGQIGKIQGHSIVQASPLARH